jgi:hypothetical protein
MKSLLEDLFEYFLDGVFFLLEGLLTVLGVLAYALFWVIVIVAGIVGAYEVLKAMGATA